MHGLVPIDPLLATSSTNSSALAQQMAIASPISEGWLIPPFRSANPPSAKPAFFHNRRQIPEKGVDRRRYRL